ncbi:transcription factor bHLH92 [Heracleum sosnowskyi]|uniref:Transcription factor bHLH92 n=1 Tax=Heracleum sosnowskyi TaxID=360622 RepID=A0AAD8I9J7_9APIA|nr:transcription factor bHLH92 [Heracleum sosnowskyi]
MEHFFETDFTWLEEVFLARPSAFVSYTQHKLDETPAFERHNINIKRRMTEFLISNSTATMQRNEFSEKERSREHVMNERMRREKQTQSYMRLHSMLPSRTKRDKLSITTTAAREVEELKKRREELKRHKTELNKMLGARETSSEGSEMEEAKIRINVARPSSGVDSMLEVLKCLKQTSSNIRLIQSKFLPQQFSAILGIETKVGAAEVEDGIHRTLIQVEERFGFNRVQPS